MQFSSYTIYIRIKINVKKLLTIANPESNSEVVAVAFNLALLMCNLLHDKPSLLPSAGI